MTSDERSPEDLRQAARAIGFGASLELAVGVNPDRLIHTIGLLQQLADELDAGPPDVVAMAREAERKRADAADDCLRYRWLRSVGFKPRAILDQALKSMASAARLDGGADQ